MVMKKFVLVFICLLGSVFMAGAQEFEIPKNFKYEVIKKLNNASVIKFKR